MNTQQIQPEITYLGKYKGEMNGEFFKAYIGIDEGGSFYESDDILDYQFKGIYNWRPLEDELLSRYDKNLHFITG